ncbi:MAG: 50S ribosomal protein L13 [Blastocatellia bacterium]
MSTHFPSGKGLESSRKWHLIDAEGQTVGRVASLVARLLMGKHKATWTPFIDVGDHVVIINAGKVQFTGNKIEAKMYHHHTGYPGGLKTISARDQLARHPERVLEIAIRGMLPKSKMGKAMASKLKVYASPEHPHGAQQPVPYKINA